MAESALKRYADIEIGETASFETAITEATVSEFAKLSGDESPIHTDEDYASKTPFGHRIAHGMIVGALFSRLVGMRLPGRYALYLSQTLRFHKPVALATTVVVKGEVTAKSDAVRTVTIATTAHDRVTGALLADGTAMVQLLY
ncbi:MAG TPA: MaoC family dehydratase [Candidatus Paceibacterota bacterium]|nr:MaoC family dehydratase [Candidatus Paceibacterota bacterium]